MKFLLHMGVLFGTTFLLFFFKHYPIIIVLLLFFLFVWVMSVSLIGKHTTHYYSEDSNILKRQQNDKLSQDVNEIARIERNKYWSGK